MAHVIELRHVDKVYGGPPDVQVLFDINIAIEAGSFNSVVGESGSGKSTLMNIIGTLDTPTAGEVVVDGQSIAMLGRDDLAELRNRTIGFVFQFHYLLPEFTAIENVLMPHAIGRQRPDREAIDWAEELFEFMGVSKVKNNPAGKMSGGQQQRVAIIRALINKPKLVLADEPTGNLDSANTANVYERFRDINQRYGTTFLIVTHDRRIAEQTDRIVEIRDGHLLMDIKK
ncbi:MAG: ABC transporter ATP-binding protein [Dehalococcoidia bacterium]|nr:MAG: ABC transporter ATP-binding protein [Dehalococcoidia bacterium]